MPEAEQVKVPYPLALLSKQELGFYRLVGRSLRAALESGDASVVAGS